MKTTAPRAIAFVLIALGAFSRPAAAQGSRIVAPNEWMSDAVLRLRERGYLANLSPLSQPWERIEIARGLAALPVSSLDTLPRQVAQWVRLLRNEFARELRKLEGAEVA